MLLVQSGRFRVIDPLVATLAAGPLWLDGNNYVGSGATWANAGTGGATLDATLVNSPTWVDDAGGRKAMRFVKTSTTYAAVNTSSLLDVAAGDSFTLLVVLRQNTPDSYGCYACRAGASRRYNISSDSTSQREYGYISDATNTPVAISGASTSGALRMYSLVRDVGADTITAYLNHTAGTPTTDSTTSAISATGSLWVSRNPQNNADYQTFDCLAVAFVKSALTVQNLTDIHTYYGI